MKKFIIDGNVSWEIEIEAENLEQAEKLANEMFDFDNAQICDDYGIDNVYEVNENREPIAK